ncbi:MAG: hypothetical protein KatS3mg003_1689 [Candidatus Nitrosocaldaceae archaeon]|nr:MAG: hypothetical protein KatS3mg003_1689 [Candidatus Nitrosocaldaceae archaeon]
MGLFKSKREKEMERKIRARKAKIMLQNYIVNLERLQKRIFTLGKEAKKLGDDKLVRRQAIKFLALESRINQAKKLLLLMEEAEAQKELVKISSSFITFTKDIANSIAEGPDASKITKMQGEFEKAMEKAEGLEEVLSVVVDTANESILSNGEFNDQKVAEVMKILDSESTVEEKNLDVSIEQKLKEVEDMMKR